MTTNFALSLSFEGISLLHRVPGGWNLVGEVALDTPNLQADLADLRAKGLHLEPDGMRTKLLIPDSQIKFLALDNARATEDEILEALKGTTPYALEDLVIDYDRTGGRTYIAAVARETLDEAESFAADHKFAPISFAAIPEPLTFRGEVFFGPTQAAEAKTPGAVIDRDDAAVNVIGQSDLSGMAGMARKPQPQRQTAAPQPEEAAPEPVFASRHNSAAAGAADAGLVLAVPTGMAEGPALAPLPDAPPPAPQPVTASAPSDFAAPPLTGRPNGVADDPARFSTRRSPELVPPLPAPAPFQTAPDPDVEMAEASEDTGRRSGKPRYLGLILTAILLVFLFLVALWANTLSEDGIAGWFRPDPAAQLPETAVAIAPPVQTQALPLPADLAPVEPVQTAPDPATASTGTPLPIVRAPVGGVLSPAEADRIYAATGVYQRAARLPVQPRETTLDGFIAAEPLPEAARPDRLALPERDPMMPDAPLPVQRNPPAADVVFPRDLRGFILATPEGTLTPDGVMVYAGGPRITPRARPGSEVIVETPQVAMAPQALDAETGVLLVPGQPPAVPPLRPEDLAPDLAEGPAAEAAPGDVAAPAAEVTEGLAVTDGRPDITPPVRPDSLVDLALAPDTPPEDATAATESDSAAAAVPPGGVELASLRPEASPERAEAASVVQPDPALAGYRPALRPEGLVPQSAQEAAPDDEPEAPETPDLTAVVAAIAQAAPPSPFQNVTPQAIAASPRPDPRPRNFAQVVSRAQAAAARQQPNVRAASTAVIERQPAVAASAQPATPSGPVPGSVAQAATFDNAIRLRDMNLIGVYGRPNARRALVRLGNGRYVKVEVGSALDGGQVTAIGDSALNFVKRGRTYALQLPQG